MPGSIGMFRELNITFMNQTEMPLYEGKKQVRAIPMSKHEFLETVKNFTIDKSEEENCPGFLVVYEDGYTSWSPENVFLKAYKPCETPLSRMEIEYDELNEKFLKLTAFLAKEDKASIVGGEYRINYMEDQREHMKKYLGVLKYRINDMKIESTTMDFKVSEDSIKLRGCITSE